MKETCLYYRSCFSMFNFGRERGDFPLFHTQPLDIAGQSTKFPGPNHVMGSIPAAFCHAEQSTPTKIPRASATYALH